MLAKTILRQNFPDEYKTYLNSFPVNKRSMAFKGLGMIARAAQNGDDEFLNTTIKSTGYDKILSSDDLNDLTSDTASDAASSDSLEDIFNSDEGKNFLEKGTFSKELVS